MIAECERLLSRFASRRVLVIGDIMLDRYWIGEASRISPEAPVPIVLRQRSSCYPGGAGNVALNVAALGSAATLIGVVGSDRAADELRDSLEGGGICANQLLVDRGRTTTVKTRIIANKQQVVRVDEEDTHNLTAEQETEVLRTVQGLLTSSDCVVLSDYAKGFVSASLASGIISAARNLGVPIVVDPKGADSARYRGATLIKPNRAELSLLTGTILRCHADALEACEQLSNKLPDVAILFTEGSDGMTLHVPDGGFVHFPTRALEVFDVTGAGDTVAAVTSVAIASGADFHAAAYLANCAAGIVVGEFGCATITAERLLPAVLESEFGPERSHQVL
ncbi:MAG: D-glycero-beta-D-manno-heptose-7-phosphate kinase [Acidobacteriaceae bacterium]|nr:D-glycero-beta-D-manno-heptose-7-phosphate kinase [Acidobacteriaceae bacterium]MBV9296553.1 D-glycero-beta-D-manno-heptose-7-phosphate kinase [Acidobacteriaceae bacterium]MBV9765037.1 D-glycero-beta-D-manno-heptose-7-phosphate kinase [Acidobacteriaceae bacterium]